MSLYSPSQYQPEQFPGDKEQSAALFGEVWNSALSLDALLVIEKRRKQIIPDLTKFTLTPLTDREPEDIFSFSAEWGIYDLKAAPGITFEYHEATNHVEQPYVDGGIGVGLAYNNRLVAVSAGVLTTSGPLLTQIQDVSCRRSDCSKRNPGNGLRHGIAWKPTLAKAWIALLHDALPRALPEMSGLPVSIQSCSNNPWLNEKEIIPGTIQFINPDTEQLKQKKQSLYNSYDKTAHFLGGIADEETGNYILPATFSIPSGKHHK